MSREQQQVSCERDRFYENDLRIGPISGDKQTKEASVAIITGSSKRNIFAVYIASIEAQISYVYQHLGTSGVVLPTLDFGIGCFLQITSNHHLYHLVGLVEARHKAKHYLLTHQDLVLQIGIYQAFEIHEDLNKDFEVNRK
jgi:hypothetical protein